MLLLLAPERISKTISASDVAVALARSLGTAAKVLQRPLASGGEGTLDAIVKACLGEFIESEVTSLDGKRSVVPWGKVEEERLVVIEAAQFHPVKKRGADPADFSSRGVGEILVQALNEGAERILIACGAWKGIDFALGAARVCGVKFLTGGGEEISEGSNALGDLDRIDLSGRRMDVLLKNILVTRSHDPVAITFFHQKFFDIVRRDMGVDIESVALSAGNNLAAGLEIFLGAKEVDGAAAVLSHINIDAELESSEMVLTTLSDETPENGAVYEVIRRAGARNIPIAVLDVRSKQTSHSAGHARFIDVGDDFYDAETDTDRLKALAKASQQLFVAS